MKRKVVLLLILILVITSVPVFGASSGVTITSKMKTYRTGSPKNNYVTGTINKAGGQTIVLYDYASKKVVASETVSNSGHSANYSLLVPTLRKAGTYKYCVMAVKGNSVVSNAVVVRVVYKSTSVADVKEKQSSSASASGNGDVQGAIDWALKIAADDSFSYGKPKRYSDGYANRAGCYFCGTNDRKIKLGGKKYEKTYMCQSFITAAFAHGAGDSKMLHLCQNHKVLRCNDTAWKNYACWTFVGRAKNLSLDDLQPGDVLVTWETHIAMYIGDGNTVDARSSGDYWGPDSIAIRNGGAKTFLKHKNKSFVMRYVGASEGTKTGSVKGQKIAVMAKSLCGSKTKATDACKRAAKEVYGSQKSLIQCHKFVGTVLGKCGYPKMPLTWSGIFKYMRKNFQEIDVDFTEEQLQPGDIRIHKNSHGGYHIWIITGNKQRAEANSTKKYSPHVHSNTASTKHAGDWLFRAK